MKRQFTFAILVSVCGLAIGSCNSSCNKAKLTKAEYIQKMDAACVKFNKDMEPSIKESEKLSESDPAKAIALSNKINEKSKSAMEELKAFPKPEEDLSTLNEFFSALESLVDLSMKLTKEAEALLKNPTMSLEKGDRLSKELDVASEKLSEAGQKYGFKECGK